MSGKAPSQLNEVTLGFRVRRDQMPLIRRVAKHLRHKSVAAWLKAIFDREFNEALLKMTPESENHDE